MAKKPPPPLPDEESIPMVDMDDIMPNFTSRGVAKLFERADVVDEKGRTATVGRGNEKRQKSIKPR